MNREINTIGSKSNCLEITNLVIELKTELEDVREQVQNIEQEVIFTMQLVNIGFGNIVSANRIIAIVSPESAPIKRMDARGKR